MASLREKAETVKAAVASAATCTPATTVLLKELLLSRETDDSSTSTKDSKPTKTPRTAKTKQNGPTSRTKKVEAEEKPELSEKEKALLASYVVNATLKSLGDAAKVSSSLTLKKSATGEEDLVQATARRRIRRSNSAPMTPMQPRSLNRVSTSPEITKKPISKPAPNASTGCLSTVECARVAFAALRSLQSASKVTLPELQLEAGMSSLVGRLLSLGLVEHASKELRLLKRRLDELVVVKGKATKSAPSTLGLAEIMDFPDTKASTQVSNLMVTTQIQVLRILSTLKRPKDIEAALPFLRTSNKSSPINLLILSGKSCSAEATKAARQLETVSQLLLTLAPSISTAEDEAASVSSLSISPSSALELQTIALHTRLCWWRLAGHKADVDKDIFSPFSKCLVAYIRRSSKTESLSYKTGLDSFNSIYNQTLEQNLKGSVSSKMPLASIYQILGKLARDSGYHSEAVSWIEKLNQMVDRSRDSAAKCFSTSALLLAHRLRTACIYPSQDALLKEVLEGLQGSLRGDSSELDELLESLVMVRKSATLILVGQVANEKGEKYQASKELRDLLETFILRVPRFCLRWLGNRPSPTDKTKEILRFEQRRTVVSESASQVLDSALMLAKTTIDERRTAWENLDQLLQDCLSLLDNLGPVGPVDSSYYAKISHLYYMQHAIFIAAEPRPIKGGTTFAHALKALRRSIDCVKHRPSKEREKAQLHFKLERISELYKTAGRTDHALTSLQTLRDSLIEDGALGVVAEALKTQSPRRAWTLNPRVESLSWSIRAIARLEKMWTDWTTHLDEPERLAALEFGLEGAISKRGTSGINPWDPVVRVLLDACPVERFPVRRLRILLRVLVANTGNEERIETIQAQVEELLSSDEQASLGEDAGLEDCLPHFRALSTSMIALARPSPDYTQLKKSISTWQAILDSSTESADLDQRIDDLPGLLEHLLSIADHARLSNHNSLLLTTLQLAADLGRKSTELEPSLNLQISAALALQLTNLGQSVNAATVLETALQSFEKAQSTSQEDLVGFQLSRAQYYVDIGNIDKAHEVLLEARKAGSAMKLMGRLEQQVKSASPDISTSSADDSGIKLDASVSESIEKDKDITPKISGPEAWKLAHPVVTGMLFLSNTYAHLGMYQETVYYAEQAQKVAQVTGSEACLAECDAWMACISARAGKLDDALKHLSEVTPKLNETEYSSKLVKLCCQISNIYRAASDFKSEDSMLEAADGMMKRMALVDGSWAEPSELLQSAAVKKTTRTTTRTKLATKTNKTKLPAPKAPTRRALISNNAPLNAVTAKAAEAPVAVGESEDSHMISLRGSVLIEKAASMIHQRDWIGAWKLLQEARQSSQLASNVLTELVATAKSLLGQSMDQMASDAVYSVIQESTLSFPSVHSGTNLDKGDRFSLMKASPPRQLDAAPRDATQPPSDGYLEKLREARECLLEAHSMASVLGDGREVHKVLGTLQTVVILLSAASSSSRKTGVIGHPGYATCAVEMARNLIWRREVKALLCEKTSGRVGLEWPEEIRSSETRRTSLSPVIDITRFQREYIDIIPEQWSAISISLSDNKHDLCISKLQAGQSPFVIRLPLERATSRDADSEVFNFHEGRTELLEIIKRANTTCHDKRDFSVKGAKTAWWQERNALDVQMKELLDKIESIWLGGFRGIFSQHQRHPPLFAKFQKKFQNILDKHLPSRSQVRGKKTSKPATKVSLDIRILELFIGLGDASDETCDFDEMLNDLLYFVVDILQFHGERNAYDEIDFDTMVVETLDALHSYHADAKDLEAIKTHGHTILVLDKALHTFPWESMPCLQGLSVSRVPSLACLRRLILDQRSSSRDSPNTDDQVGHHVSIDNGTYILNPSGDLKATQDTFEAPLSSSLSSSWTRVENKPPTEAEFENALARSDILLYMGHGGGAQYIRNRQIRRLDKCRATTLLMGCSSASLNDVGDFEVYGLVWSYMLAGCPAVVGTLWDVTDKDIDLYTGQLYEEWGVIKRGTFGAHLARQAAKAKAGDDSSIKRDRSVSRKRTAPEEAEGREGRTACEYGDASLPEAVARAKNSGVCKFKYLNAGAVCVYGIPVYVDRHNGGQLV
ncbi:separin protein [Gnomoniopsis smithogilvyi]|uniref:separase n=1 Tax=Gnomoniopsis smithogilvyi TaxID=1191159 RepID=A0A9W9CWN5_9PEZI|nr:separin protein [Gnomoniopsis smithogilvyi]